MNGKNHAVKTVGMVMIIVTIGKLTGLYRDMLFAEHFGIVAPEAVAFDIASLIPRQFLDFIFASALSSSFIPIFCVYLERKSKREAFRLASNFICIITLSATALTVLLMVFSHQAVALFAPGLTDPWTVELSVRLLRIMLPTLILSSTAFSLVGVLQGLEEFNIPAAMSLISNGVIIVYYWFFLDRFGVFGLAAVFLIGWTTQVLIQLPSLIKLKFSFRPLLDFKDSGIKEVVLLMLPVMASAWVQPVNVTVNTRVASGLFGGSGEGIRALNTANTLYATITGIFIFSIANVVFTQFSKQKANNDEQQFGETVRGTLCAMFYLLMPMMTGLMLLSRRIISFVFERGEFDAHATELTSRALLFYSVGILGLGLQTILSRGFYASKNGKTPLLTGLVAITLNFLLSITLVGWLDVGGPALASAVSINITGLIMLAIMYRKNNGVFNRQAFISFLKMFVSAVVMAAVVWGVLSFVPAGGSFAGKIVGLAAPVGTGITAYVLFTYVLRVEETVWVVNKILRRV